MISNLSGIQKFTGFISDYSAWDDTINAFVKRFHKEHKVYPNILLANKMTFCRIDRHVHLEALVDKDGVSYEKSEIPYEGIGSFEANNYSLVFCINNQLIDDSFVLIFDAEPDFDDGEPIPEEEENISFYYRKCA